MSNTNKFNTIFTPKLVVDKSAKVSIKRQHHKFRFVDTDYGNADIHSFEESFIDEKIYNFDRFIEVANPGSDVDTVIMGEEFLDEDEENYDNIVLTVDAVRAIVNEKLKIGE